MGKRSRRLNREAREQAAAVEPAAVRTGETPVWVRSLMMPLEQIERSAREKRAAMTDVLTRRGRQLQRGEIGVLRDGLSLILEHDRVIARQAAMDIGQGAIAKTIHRELQHPSVAVIVVRLPEEVGTDD